MNPDPLPVGKTSLAHAQRQGKCRRRPQRRSALPHTGPHHFPAWRNLGWPQRLGTGVWLRYARHCRPGGGTSLRWELWRGAERTDCAMNHWHPRGDSPGVRQRETAQGTAGQTGSHGATLLCHGSRFPGFCLSSHAAICPPPPHRCKSHTVEHYTEKPLCRRPTSLGHALLRHRTPAPASSRPHADAAV